MKFDNHLEQRDANWLETSLLLIPAGYPGDRHLSIFVEQKSCINLKAKSACCTFHSSFCFIVIFPIMLVAVALGALVIVIVWKCTSTNESYPPYAPGRLPVIGHLHHLAGNITAQELFRRWSLQKGPIFTVQLGVKRWVILNSMDAVNKLIVERSTVYSSRNLPDTLVNDLFYGGVLSFLLRITIS